MRLTRLLFVWSLWAVLLSPTDLFSAEKLKLAVTDLDALGVPENIALSTSELFRTELFKTGYFHVLERKQMKKVLEEQALSLSGALATEDAAQIGKLLAVHLIVFGSINKLGDEIIVNIRLVDVEQGRLKAADTANARELEGIQDAVKKLSKVISEAIPLRGKVVKIRGDEVIVSLGRLDRINPGDFLRVQRLGETYKDPGSGKTLGREIIEVASLKVDQVIDDELSRTLLVEEYGTVQAGDIVIVWSGRPGETPAQKPRAESKPVPPSREEEPFEPRAPSGKKKPSLPPPGF